MANVVTRATLVSLRSAYDSGEQQQHLQKGHDCSFRNGKILPFLVVSRSVLPAGVCISWLFIECLGVARMGIDSALITWRICFDFSQSNFNTRCALEALAPGKSIPGALGYAQISGYISSTRPLKSIDTWPTKNLFRHRIVPS